MMSATIFEGRRASKERTSSPFLKPFEEKNRCGEVGKDRNGVEDSEAHEQVPRLKEGANCQTQDALVRQWGEMGVDVKHRTSLAKADSTKPAVPASRPIA